MQYALLERSISSVFIAAALIHLASQMKQDEFVIEGSKFNEALACFRINVVFISCIAEEKEFALEYHEKQPVSSDSSPCPITPVAEPASLVFQFETKLKFKVTYQGEKRTLHDIADYSL